MGWVYYLIVPSLKLIQIVNRNYVDANRMDLLDTIKDDLKFFQERYTCNYDIENTKLGEVTIDTINILIEAYKHSQLFEYLSPNHCLALWLDTNNIEYKIIDEFDIDLSDYKDYKIVD